EGLAPAPLNECQMGPELPPSQETGEVCGPSDLFQAPGQPSTPAREGAEENMTANALRSAIFLLFFLAVSISAKAQNQSSNAHLSGTILDSSGAGIGAVNVTAQLEGNTTAQLWKTSSSTD